MITGIPYTFGGEEHQGWLPRAASRPAPTPARTILLDLTIEESGDGALLIWQGPSEEYCGDNWYPSVRDAELEAQAIFGVAPDAWVPAA